MVKKKWFLKKKRCDNDGLPNRWHR